MTKALASFPEERRMDVARRRTANLTGGNGYWGAVSFLNGKGIYTKEQKLAIALKETIKNANNQVENKQRKWEKDNDKSKVKKFKHAKVPTFAGRNKAVLKRARKQLA